MKHSSHWSPQILGTLPLDKILKLHCDTSACNGTHAQMLPLYLVIKTEGLLDAAEGCKHKPQAAHKQASVLWAAYCLYLQPSAVEKAWTLHLCPVGATADCESAHRSCPTCGSRIDSQQVSVLGQPLNGILSRCIPWRTPVSSCLRSSGPEAFHDVAASEAEEIYFLYLAWALAVRRDTQGNQWNKQTWSTRCNDRMWRTDAMMGCNARCLADAAALLGFKNRKALKHRFLLCLSWLCLSWLLQRTDETQVPAFKLAAWRQETMSEK